MIDMRSSMVAGSMDCGRAIDGQDRRDTGEKERQIRAQARARLEVRDSSSWDEGRRQAGLSRAPKEERAIAASLPCPRIAHALFAGRPLQPRTSRAQARTMNDLGPTLLQILSRSRVRGYD